jgi:hypothetical protein
VRIFTIFPCGESFSWLISAKESASYTNFRMNVWSGILSKNLALHPVSLLQRTSILLLLVVTTGLGIFLAIISEEKFTLRGTAKL